MKELLLIPLKLRDLPLFSFVIRLKLLHQLLVRFDQGGVLNEGGDLVVLFALSVVDWTLCLLSVVKIVHESRVEADSSGKLLLKIGN